MDIRNVLSGQMIAAFIVAVCLFSSMPVAASVKHRLSGNAESSSHGSDSKGYFWGGNFSSNTLGRVYAQFKGDGDKFKGSDRNFKNNGRNNNDWSSGWRSLGMSLGQRQGRKSKDNDNSSFSPGEDDDFERPAIEYPMESELHYDGSTGLTFENWRKDPYTNTWHDYDDDDDDDDDDDRDKVKQSQIPEPSSFLLLLLGLYGIVATRKVRSNA